MRKITYSKVVASIGGLLMSLVSLVSFGQATNIAPNATVTASNCQTGACSTLNDLNFGTCGTQQMWISTAGPPSLTLGVDFIEWNFPNPVAFDSLVIHHAQTTGRFLTGATVQYWDGVAWVTHTTFSNLPQVCVNRVPIGKLVTDRFRITRFIPGTGQNSNMNFREIEIMEAPSGTNDAALMAVDSPAVFCAGVQDVYVNVRNFGINQLDSVDIVWEVNGVAQPTFSFIGLLDTLNGTGTTDTSINIGSATFNAGANTVLAYTTNPNGGSDTINFNDTVNVSLSTALRPTFVDRFNPTLTSIDIFANNVSNQLDYEYGLKGYTFGTGISGSSTVLPFTITGLASGTEYDIYVRNNCGGGDTSLWLGPRSFITSFDIPYFQDFQAFTPGIVQNPWPEGYTSFTTDPEPGFNLMRWESESANGFNNNTINTGPLFDHTLFGTSGGRYVYFEAGFTFTGTDTAALYTPPIEIPASETVIEVSYWYFAHGAEIDRLEVHVDTNGTRNNIATYFGQQQTSQSDEWRQEVVYLTGYEGTSLKLNFTGFATFDNADIAIDDIRIDTVPDLNASLQEIVEPSGALCPGAIDPVVAVRNRGVNDLTSVDVVSDVNGVLDTTSFTFPAVAVGDSIHLTLPSTTFSSGITYDISYYVINPNNGVDENASDDTLSLDGLVTGLAGAITIDPSLAASATNYTSFNAFSNTVNSVGVCGEVTVTVAAGTYTDNIRLLSVPGTSPTDRLVIDGVSPDSVTLNRGTNNANGTVVFENTRYVTIKNMTIRNTNNAGDNFGVHFSQNSQYDSILDCRIELSQTATFSNFGVGASSVITNDFAEGNNANNIAVIGCTIDGGSYSIHFEGGGFGNFNVGNSFIDNELLNFNNYAFYGDDQDSLVFNGNYIRSNRTNNFNNAFYCFDAMNFDIIGNDVIIPNWAFYITNANSGADPVREAQLINNMVVSTQPNGRCIYLTNPLRINMYHNSVRHLGTTNPAVEFGGFGFIDSLDVRNNIFSSESSIAFEMNGGADTTVFLRFDNNAYYSRTAGDIISIGADGYATLTAYQVARPGLNINSVEGNPSYISDSNLRVVGILVNDIGDNGVNVLEDIDGDPRPSPNATFVDPGADEFDPPACPAPIGFDVTVEGPDSITVYWRSGFPGSTVEYNWTLSGNALGTGDLDSSTVDTVGIGSLVSNTSYDVYIREICRRGDTSIWVGPITIETPCAPFTARYRENFETSTVGEAPDCWTTMKTYNEPNAYVEVQGFNSRSIPNHLAMYSWTNYTAASDTLAAISPQMSDMPNGNTEINFWSNVSSLNNDLIVMTTDMPDGTGSFTVIDTITYTATNVWQESFVEFTTANGYNGTDEYIVLAHSLGQTFSFVRIDDFVYDTIPSCRAPRDLSATDLTADSATLGWANPSGATSWEIQIDTAGNSLGSSFDTVVTSNPARLGDLISNQDYEWRVRAICGVADTSLWTPISEFATKCDPFTTRYDQDFDSEVANETPSCWTAYISYNEPNAYVEVQGFNSRTTPNHLAMYSWTNFNAASDTMAAITPLFSDLVNGNTEINFWSNVSNTNNELYIMTTDKSDGTGTFTPIDTVTYTATNVWQESFIEFTTANGYNGTDQYIALMHSLDATFSFVRIDDFIYDTIPSCRAPRNLTANNIKPDSADLGWDNPGTATSFEIEIDTLGFTLGTGFDTVVTANPMTIPGLLPNTRYEWRVRGICGVGDTSAWTSISEFRTACVAETASYLKDFDNDAVNEPPSCWTSYKSYPEINAYTNVQGFNSFSAPNHLAMYSWTNYNALSDTLAVISPQFSDLDSNDKRIRFHANTSSLNNDLIVMTADAPEPNANFTVIDTIDFGSSTINVWEEYTLDITTANNYNGTDQYIVLAHSLGQTFSFVRIDEFHYETIPTCLRPTDLISNTISGDSVGVSWTDPNSATEWEISYGALGFNPDTGIKVISTGLASDTLTGLSTGTRYEWAVRAICTPGDTSFWRNTGYFVTECNAISAPHFNGFEDDLIDSIPLCWAGVNTIAGVNAFVSVEGPGFVGQPRTGNRSLVMYSWNGIAGIDQLRAVAPEASDITTGDKRIRFWMNSSSLLSGVTVGTAPDQTALGTVSVLQTVLPTSVNTWEEYTVDITTLNGYNGTDEYISLGHNLGQTFTYVRIDDLNYEEIPSCVRPNGLLGQSMPSGDSVEINWTEVNTATEWEVSYGLPGFSVDTGTRFFTSNKPDTISGLATGTGYEFYVRSICTAGDTSFWSRVGSFQTDCQPVTAPAFNPYFNGFENDQIDSVPLCWNMFHTYNQPNAIYSVQGPGFAGQPRTGVRSIAMYSWTNFTAGTDRMAAVTPELDDLTFNDKRINFWLSSSNVLNTGLIVGTSTTNDANGVFTPMDTLFPTTNNTWERFSIEFTAATGYNGVDKYISLDHNLGGTFTYIRIDDFEYESFLTCIAPNNVMTMNTSFDTTDLTWTVLDSATEWEVQYGTQGFNLGSGTSFFTTSDTVSITGLSSATYYDVYVRGICGAGDTSRWSTVSSFLTSCDLRPITLPFVDDWETISGTIIGDDVVSCDTTHYWTFETDGPQGRLRYGTNAFAKANSTLGAVTMDIASGNTLTKNRLILTLDLSLYAGSQNMDLSFYLRDHTDEVHAGDRIWARGSSNDPWVQVFNVAQNASAVYTKFTVDLYTPLNAASQDFSSTFQIAFGQEDDGSTPNDGVSFDSVMVDGTVNTVGIGNNSTSENTISVYPNPSNGYFTLNINTISNENYNMIVRDVKGQAVYSRNVSVNGTFRDQLDLTGLSKGIYFLQIQSENDTKVEKLIIQ